MFPGTASLDLDEVGGREDGAEQSQVQNVGTVVPRGHHADRDADPRFTRKVRGKKVPRSEQVVVTEIHGKPLGIRDLRRDLHCEVRLVFVRKHHVGHRIEDLSQC